MQKNDACGVAYGPKSLEGQQQRYCTRRRQLLDIMNFVNQFRPYLYGCKVLNRTDHHASLKYIKTINNPGDQSARWIECLELYYTIEVRSGVKHCNADELSPMRLARNPRGRDASLSTSLSWRRRRLIQPERSSTTGDFCLCTRDRDE